MLEGLAVVLAALVLGVGSAWWLINHPPDIGAVKNGAWRTNASIGSPEANMVVRAMVARIGLFALNKTETIYYTAFTDDQGEPLRSECDYRIEGNDIGARWWSITVYGRDHFLIPNDQDRYAYNMANVGRDQDGKYKIHLSGTPKPGNWLPTGKGGRFSVSLRVYNPDPKVYENMDTVELPRIVKEACR